MYIYIYIYAYIYNARVVCYCVDTIISCDANKTTHLILTILTIRRPSH